MGRPYLKPEQQEAEARRAEEEDRKRKILDAAFKKRYMPAPFAEENRKAGKGPTP